MKTKLLILTFLIFNKISFSQSFAYINFDDSNWSEYVKIDSASNSNNIWEVGVPSKNILDNSNSSPNVIITKLSGSYPINDTSSFIIERIADMGFYYHHTVSLQGKYFVNSDSLSDYGKIEFSYDLGNSWIDLKTSSNINQYPQFTGNSNAWEYFYIDILSYDTIVNNVSFGDTLFYRFSFISDNIETMKDGLMFDDIDFDDYFEGINEIKNDNLISIYPNPTADHLIIQRKTSINSQSIQVLNYTGQIVYENKNYTGDHIDTRQYKNGIYFLKYSDEKESSLKKFIVNH